MEFAPVLRQGLIDLLDLLDLRGRDPRHGEAAHVALVAAVGSGDGEEAARLARTELESTLAPLRAPGAAPGDLGLIPKPESRKARSPRARVRRLAGLPPARPSGQVILRAPSRTACRMRW
ncbi:hypothetical protein [Streptomyces sp. NPDC056480]|uniref:hypothetical protein n=1 Tax=Streptomyces sp. NPDC056480 TaxID=3345833 RepID=UPI0036A7596F